MECQGQCKNNGTCTGDVVDVVVYGLICPTGMNFQYCETAIKTDEDNGYLVEKIDEHGFTGRDYDAGITYPNGQVRK